MRHSLREHSGFQVGQRVYLRVATTGATFVELNDDEEREDEITYPAGTPAVITDIERINGGEDIAFTVSIGEIANTFDDGDGLIGDILSAEPLQDDTSRLRADSAELARIRAWAKSEGDKMDAEPDPRSPDGDNWNDLYSEIMRNA